MGARKERMRMTNYLWDGKTWLTISDADAEALAEGVRLAAETPPGQPCPIASGHDAAGAPALVVTMRDGNVVAIPTSADPGADRPAAG
jgi:hypothetical protein